MVKVMSSLRKKTDFSGGSSGEQSAFQYREHGFNPWSGKIPHSTCSTTAKTVCRSH